jgi:phage-related protein
VADASAAYSVFPWLPDATSHVESEVQTEQLQLGGGYELRANRGAHPWRRRLVLEFSKRTATQASEIRAFFQGARERSFPIQDPDSGEWLQVRIDGPVTLRPNGIGRLRDVSVGIVEVFQP